MAQKKEEKKQKTLEDLNETEIKAMLYEQIVVLDRTQKNIEILNKRLAELQNGSKADKPE